MHDLRPEGEHPTSAENRGQLTNLRYMEEKLAALLRELNDLPWGVRPGFGHVLVRRTPEGESDTSSNMMWIESTKQEPPYVVWTHNPDEG